VIGPEGGAWSEGAAGVDVLVMSSSVSSSYTVQLAPQLSVQELKVDLSELHADNVTNVNMISLVYRLDG
jgi:hypothetical protein